MQEYPALRQCARQGAVLPPVAPKNATVLVEDMVVGVVGIASIASSRCCSRIE